MSLAITLRKHINPNLFREIILHVIEKPLGDEIILCSGFFQENKKTKSGLDSYQISTEGKFADYLQQNNIKITSIGVHNGAWRNEYIRFRNNLNKRGIKLTAKVTGNYKWHAKIFLLKKNGKPILGIVGSSNMTKKAFSNQDFNFEADVIMWCDELDEKIKPLVIEIGNKNYGNQGKEGSFLGFDDIILADYNPATHNGKTIQGRLIDLENEINIVNLKDLP